jgi:hypothetical protein
MTEGELNLALDALKAHGLIQETDDGLSMVARGQTTRQRVTLRVLNLIATMGRAPAAETGT